VNKKITTFPLSEGVRWMSFAIIFISLLFGGCFVWTAIKDGWGDFTAYFNTYYNGETAFNEAMKNVDTSLIENRISSLSGQEMPFMISGTAKQNFDIAIEKASKILQFYPNSGYVENCLFMIGISYYYEGDNIRGGRKFAEEQSKFPDSKRFAEAEMYYGEIEIRNREYQNGLRDLTSALALAEKQKDSHTAELASSDISDYYVLQNDTVTATAYLDSAATYSKGDDAAIYLCSAGRLCEELRNYQTAKREYGRAWDEAKDIKLKFYSRYFLARDERRLKTYGAALEQLRYLRKDDKYFQFFPLIDYQRAEVLYDSGAVSDAVTEFQRIDTAYATTEGATRSAFRLANIYLYKVGDFQTALKYFQRCSVHPSVLPLSTTASQMATSLQDYFVTNYKVKLADSLYDVALLAGARRDSTKKADSTKKTDSTASVSATSQKQSEANLDTLYERAADAERDLAGLYMFKLQIPDSAIKQYESLVKYFPKSSVYASSLYTLGEYFYSSGDTATGKKYLDRLMREYPQSKFAVSVSSLLGTPAPQIVDSSQAEYDAAIDSANHGKDSSAIAILMTLSKKEGKSQIVPHALYAIGWIYENKLAQPDSAFVYYKKLAWQYPSSELAASVTVALAGFEQAQRDSVAARKRVADSIANVAKSVATDSSKTKKTEEVEQLHPSKTVSPPAQRSILPESLKNPDSLGIAKRLPVDSLANKQKSVDSTQGKPLVVPGRPGR